MYCIYSGKDLNADEMTIEHIIPLSLGGSNEFTIKVGRKINNDLGSKIDGELSKDFIIKLYQLPHDNKGHSKREQKLNLRGVAKGRPVTWTFSKDGIKIYDHKSKKILIG